MLTYFSRGWGASGMRRSLECVECGDIDEGEDHRPVGSDAGRARWNVCSRIAARIRHSAFAQIVCSSQHSVRLLCFLALNVLFMGLEALVGFLTNSLSLTTDAMHMLLDCAALVVGLVGETMRQQQQLPRQRRGVEFRR